MQSNYPIGYDPGQKASENGVIALSVDVEAPRKANPFRSPVSRKKVVLFDPKRPYSAPSRRASDSPHRGGHSSPSHQVDNDDNDVDNDDDNDDNDDDGDAFKELTLEDYKQYVEVLNLETLPPSTLSSSIFQRSLLSSSLGSRFMSSADSRVTPLASPHAELSQSPIRTSSRRPKSAGAVPQKSRACRNHQQSSSSSTHQKAHLKRPKSSSHIRHSSQSPPGKLRSTKFEVYNGRGGMFQYRKDKLLHQAYAAFRQTFASPKRSTREESSTLAAQHDATLLNTSASVLQPVETSAGAEEECCNNDIIIDGENNNDDNNISCHDNNNEESCKSDEERVEQRFWVVGAAVEAWVESKAKFYQGSITRVHEDFSKFDIFFDDGNKEFHVPKEYLRSIPQTFQRQQDAAHSQWPSLRPGDRVSANYMSEGCWYSGTVRRVVTRKVRSKKGSPLKRVVRKYDIVFDDGDVEQAVDITRLRPLKRSAVHDSEDDEAKCGDGNDDDEGSGKKPSSPVKPLESSEKMMTVSDPQQSPDKHAAKEKSSLPPASTSKVEDEDLPTNSLVDLRNRRQRECSPSKGKRDNREENRHSNLREDKRNNFENKRHSNRQDEEIQSLLSSFFHKDKDSIAVASWNQVNDDGASSIPKLKCNDAHDKLDGVVSDSDVPVLNTDLHEGACLSNSEKDECLKVVDGMVIGDIDNVGKDERQCDRLAMDSNVSDIIKQKTSSVSVDRHGSTNDANSVKTADIEVNSDDKAALNANADVICSHDVKSAECKSALEPNHASMTSSGYSEKFERPSRESLPNLTTNSVQSEHTVKSNAKVSSRTDDANHELITSPVTAISTNDYKDDFEQEPPVQAKANQITAKSVSSNDEYQDDYGDDFEMNSMDQQVAKEVTSTSNEEPIYPRDSGHEDSYADDEFERSSQQKPGVKATSVGSMEAYNDDFERASASNSYNDDDFESPNEDELDEYAEDNDFE